MKIDTIQILAAVLLISACGDKPTDVPPAAEQAPPAPAPQPAPVRGAPEHAEHAAAAVAETLAQLPPVPQGAKVSFVSPADGATIEGPLENGKISVPVKMGVEGIALEPAGPVTPGSGHHHILIDAEAIPVGVVIPKDEQHEHFGKAQSEATLLLAPGPHKLSLQYGDGIHRSYGPQLAATITITTAAMGSVPAPAPAKHKRSAVKP
jgi:predicted small lipoprotein YifL